jgi:hypothetical protein
VARRAAAVLDGQRDEAAGPAGGVRNHPTDLGSNAESNRSESASDPPNGDGP